jgi:hypothetical protein
MMLTFVALFEVFTFFELLDDIARHNVALPGGGQIFLVPDALSACTSSRR